MPTGKRPLPGPLSREVSRLLKTALEASGRSQAAVAASSGLSAAQLSRALSHQKVLTIDELDALCATLNLDLAAVVTSADNSTADRRSNVVRLDSRRHDAPPFEVHEERGAAYDQADGEVSDPEEP